MACKRDRTEQLISYAQGLGIDVNVGKNKARGNKGFFKAKSNNYRIDIAKNLSEIETLRVLIHEIVHYIHYTYDKTLKSTEFIFKNNYEEYEEDLLKLTVNAVPKDFAEKLFRKKEDLKKEIKILSENLKKYYPDVKLSDKNNKIQKEISKTEFKHLLKYDRVRVLSGLKFKIYSIKNLTNDFPNIKPEYEEYLKLCSIRRKLNNLNNRIYRLNKYYTTPSELLARSFEYYTLEPEYMEKATPALYSYYKELGSSKSIKYLSELLEIAAD